MILPSIKSRVPSDLDVLLKWPNDVLVENKKICGILIEIEDDMVLIGIGCNIMSAPTIDRTGLQHGRAATCLADHNNLEKTDDQLCESVSPPDNDDSLSSSCINHSIINNKTSKEIATEIYNSLNYWLKYSNIDGGVNEKDSAANVIADFERNMAYSSQQLRDNDGPGQTVIPLSINNDGTLKVSNV